MGLDPLNFHTSETIVQAIVIFGIISFVLWMIDEVRR